MLSLHTRAKWDNLGNQFGIVILTSRRFMDFPWYFYPNKFHLNPLMSAISYDKSLVISDSPRPTPMANKSLPYNLLADSRRFEELLFSVYESEIKYDGFNDFDDINLMSGIRDRGRDCVLLKKGKNCGLIQCKKYAGAYSKEDFGMEITKFALYSLVDTTLIYDANDFIYYIAVSTGFVLGCNQFIDDFNNLILTDKALDKWISKNLEKSELSVLNLKERRTEVLDILTKIKVRRIIPVTLDSLLFKQHNAHLLPLFFQVTVLPDGQVIDSTSKRVSVTHDTGLSKEQLNTELIRSSIILDSQRNQFEGIPSSHIPRAETEKLYSWITSPARKDQSDHEENICLLAANAGMGKTVIMKDLYDRLRRADIPVLALKADRLYAGNLKSLQEKIGISIPVFEFIEACKQHFPQLVILIDQIDALSQALSADRSFLTTYTQLINSYKYDPSVRIIISVRIFDLYYDPSLRLYKDIKSFEVQLLDEKAVLQQLEKLGVHKNSISRGLSELLRTPNNLDVFSRIHKPDRNFAGISSIQDLYNELWNSKILDIPADTPVNSSTLIDLVYNIAGLMYENQQITVSELRFERHRKELNYLKTERMVKVESAELQFFHQSFYDFVFAKRFVEGNSSITEFLEIQEQSIMSRSALKMILNHLRSFDHHTYIGQIKDILTSAKFYFHIKHLLISTIASQERPTQQEMGIITELVMTVELYAEIFFEQANGAQWLAFLMDNNYLETLLSTGHQKAPGFTAKFGFLMSHETDQKEITLQDRNRRLTILLHFLRKNGHYDRDRVLDFLPTTNENYLIFRCLYNMKDWANPKAMLLLDRFNEKIPESSWGYLSVLEEVAEYDPAYVFERIKNKLFIRADRRQGNEDYHDKTLFRLMFEKISDDICTYVLDLLKKEIPVKTFDTGRNSLQNDYFVGGYNLEEDDHASGPEYFYQLFALEMRKQAKSKSPVFSDFLSLNLLSPYYSLIKLVIFSLQTNEADYSPEIFKLVTYLSFSGKFEYLGGLDTDIRFLLRDAYPCFTETQKNEIKECIKNLVVKDEMGRSSWEGHRIYSDWGKSQFLFLKALPLDEINDDPELKRKFQELMRRHGDLQEKRRRHGGVLAGVVGRPLDEKAYKFMSKAAWISSFKKYHAGYNSYHDTRDNRHLKGGMLEHSKGFDTFCVANPEKGLEIINAVIDDSEVDVFYSIRGLDGLTGLDRKNDGLLSLLKKVIKKPLDTLGYIYILQLTEKLIDEDAYDEDILDWIIEQALHNPNPEQEKLSARKKNKIAKSNDDAHYGLSTVRGMAGRRLVHITDKRHESKIFGTIAIILRKDVPVVKAAIMNDYAYLMNLNPQKAFDLFVKVVRVKKNTGILSSTLWSLQYLVNYDFTRLVPLFEKLITLKHMKDNDYSSLSSILFGAWIREFPGAKLLFEAFVKSNDKVKAHAMNDAIRYLYIDGEKSEVSVAIVEMLLESTRSELNKDIELYFSHMANHKFKDIYPLAVKYISSPFFRLRESFLEYLTENAATFPCECIDLFESAINKKVDPDKDDSNEFFGSEDVATKFVVGAYNSLRPTQIPVHGKYRVKLLNVFDKILVDVRFRSTAEIVLEKVIA
jgi:hypothetical protein